MIKSLKVITKIQCAITKSTGAMESRCTSDNGKIQCAITKNPRLGFSYHVKNIKEIMMLIKEKNSVDERHIGERRESSKSIITKVSLWPIYTCII